MRRYAFGLAAAMLCIASAAPGAVTPAVEEARKNYDKAAFAPLLESLVEQSRQDPESYAAQFAVAECLLIRADFLRRERFVQGGGKAKRKQQNAWAKEAMPYAVRALECAASDSERAHANRVIGELYSHQITGMMSGMRNGPKSKDHIGKALEVLPDDLECKRAFALMYLYNPGISGGDAKKAVASFKECAGADSGSDAYVLLLAMSYRKAGEMEEARSAAQDTLALNPKNTDAKDLLEALKE